MLKLPGDVIHELVGSCHSIDAKIGLYQEPQAKGSSALTNKSLRMALASMGIRNNPLGMLSNGGRFYIDPSGPEYATPETSSAEEAVIRSYDGDRILLGVFEYLRRESVLEGYQANRRIVDHNRTSRGIHLNTTTKLNNTQPSQSVRDWLATLNVAKGAMFGSGGLLRSEDGSTSYHHSPRLSVTTSQAGHYEQYTQRPLVRFPFKKDHDKLSRIETVTGDALNFAWPMRASLVATNALVGLIELGYGDKLPKLVEPVTAAQTIGEYGHDARLLVSDNRDAVSINRPLDVMRRICELIVEVNRIEEFLDGESDQVIGEIIDVADRMTADPYSVADQVESMGRLLAMEIKMEKDGLTLDSERMCRFDYAWDWLDGGIAERLREKGKAGWQGMKSRPSSSKKQLATPPQNTRAKVRGEAIKQAASDNTSDWHRIEREGIDHYLHPLTH